ncbi:flowering-promoting factor 1-like protein 1 [Spinacia oleracea]|uniref:Flowering-promoting factor 1-like protein 1 n=1 Tax=Spinacia oleracea TaxID=3562 RepID=A0ABM3QQF3_SPIOL|nr:flowering-promoting factor 1-like protein 1 [Spinacia oleracea]
MEKVDAYLYVTHNTKYTPLVHAFSPIYLNYLKISGVWVFKNGVVRLVENPGADSMERGHRKVLVHVPTNQVVTCYEQLEAKLFELGWERYYDDAHLLQFHKRSTVHLISLPKDFRKFNSMHMFDIVVKNRNMFQVRDV